MYPEVFNTKKSLKMSLKSHSILPNVSHSISFLITKGFFLDVFVVSWEFSANKTTKNVGNFSWENFSSIDWNVLFDTKLAGINKINWYVIDNRRFEWCNVPRVMLGILIFLWFLNSVPKKKKKLSKFHHSIWQKNYSKFWFRAKYC